MEYESAVERRKWQWHRSDALIFARAPRTIIYSGKILNLMHLHFIKSSHLPSEVL